MRLERLPDPGEIPHPVATFLGAREAEHNLLHGILGRLRREPQPHGRQPYVAAVLDDEGDVVALALRTPPWGLVLSEIDGSSAIDLLVDDVHEVYGPELPGVLGPKDSAAGFAQRWEERTGRPGRIAIEERIYRCERVSPPDGVDGNARDFHADDTELVLSWLDAFWAEALSEVPGEQAPSDWLEQRLADPDGAIVLWEHGDVPVSLASCGSATPSGIRIGPVYTPPDCRRRGYGSAVTAVVTERELRAGRDFCFLFTNLGNPTSNAIYQRIGYEPVTDVDQWSFERA